MLYMEISPPNKTRLVAAMATVCVWFGTWVWRQRVATIVKNNLIKNN